MSSVTVVIPESYNLTKEMGYGATYSGWLIGSAWPLSAFVALAIAPKLREWNQPWCRNVLVGNYFLQAIASFFFAMAADPRLSLPLPPTLQYTLVIGSRLLVGVSAGTDIILNVMVWKVVPRASMVNLEVMKVCIRTFAIGLGPLVSSGLNFAFGAHDVRSRASFPAQVFAALWISFGVYAWMVIPNDITPFTSEKSARDDAEPAEGSRTPTAVSVDNLSEADRQTVWFGGIMYGMERAFLVSALEAATALILEKEFRMGTQEVGVAVGATFFVGLPITLLVDAARRGHFISDVSLLSGAAAVATLASLMLFPMCSTLLGHCGVHVPGLSVLLVLLADCVIFPAGYLANGILDGFAVQCSKAGTFCCVENFRLMEGFLQDAVARLIAPVIARTLVDRFGRLGYSAMQLSVSALGLASCVSVVLVLARSHKGGSSLLASPAAH